MSGCLGDFLFLNVLIMGAFNKKCPKFLKKSIIFLAPPPSPLMIMWTPLRTVIILLAAWPIKGNFVPHENGGKLTLTSLFHSNSDKILGEILTKS